MPPWLQQILQEQGQNPYEQQQPNPQHGVHGNNMAPIFAALAQYLGAQPRQQQERLNLARDIGTGVSTSPHDMLYGRDNPSAAYNPDHDAYWRRTFGTR